MPLDKIILLLVVVVAAAGVTISMIAFVFAALAFPRFTMVALIPALLVGYVVWRVIAQRMRSREDTHYDNVDP